MQVGVTNAAKNVAVLNDVPTGMDSLWNGTSDKSTDTSRKAFSVLFVCLQDGGVASGGSDGQHGHDAPPARRQRLHRHRGPQR